MSEFTCIDCNGFVVKQIDHDGFEVVVWYYCHRCRYRFTHDEMVDSKRFDVGVIKK